MQNLEIGVSGSADISGDREMLQVVFQNILMNAAQAMEGQGRIDVTITRADGRCRVAVADRGPGMPEEVREKAFDAFFTTKHRGTGLGLPIARRVVEAHGGTIQIDVPPTRRDDHLGRAAVAPLKAPRRCALLLSSPVAARSRESETIPGEKRAQYQRNFRPGLCVRRDHPRLGSRNGLVRSVGIGAQRPDNLHVAGLIEARKLVGRQAAKHDVRPSRVASRHP